MACSVFCYCEGMRSKESYDKEASAIIELIKGKNWRLTIRNKKKGNEI